MCYYGCGAIGKSDCGITEKSGLQNGGKFGCGTIEKAFFRTTGKSAIGESLCRVSVFCRFLTRLFFVIIAVFLFSSFVSCSSDGESFIVSNDKTADLNIAVSAAGISVSAAGASMNSSGASDNAFEASAGASVNSSEASAGVSGASVSASGMSALKEVSSDDSVPEEFSSKGLIVEINDTILTSGTDSLYWGYTLVKTDSFGKTGEKQTITPLNGGNPGLANLKNLSVGKWKMVLSAYKTSALNTSGIVYRSRETEFSIKASGGNSIRIPISKVQDPDAKGTLRILPRELTIAEEPYAAFSVQENGQAMADENIIRTPFGKLSEYSYRIYLYTDKTYSEGEQILADTTADVAQTMDTVIEKSLTPGRYFFKIEIFRVKDTGDSHAETYLAFFPVEVYSNTVSTVKNREEDGVHAGLDVKEVREFKISYYDQGSSDNIPFSGVHPPVVNSELGVNYIKVHQYGRTEELDEPEKEGYGFAGWYTSYNGGVRVTSVPAWQYSDVKLYAKWTVKRYKSITYIDNFPLKALERKSGMTSHSDTYTRSTVSETDYIAMPSDPVCVGYVFNGWEIDASHKGYSYSNGLPPAWKADIEAVCRAQWEPVHYKVVVRCHSSINPAADFENYAEISAQVARLSTSWSNYDSEYPIIDPKTSKYGFLGYKKGNANASDPSNYVYNEAEMFGTEGYYKNLTENNGETVYFYAIFSDYFTPLEYIRSYPSSQTAGPLIDTLAKCNLTDTGVSRLVMDVELAGQEYGGRGFVCGSSSSPYNFLLATTGGRSGYWRFWSGGTEGIVGDGYKDTGLYFEDEKYHIDMNITESTSSISVNGELLESLPHASGRFHGGNIVFLGWNNNSTNEHNHRGDIRIYSAFLYNFKGEVIRRFQPCILKTALPAAFSSDGAGTHTTGEIGLWDLKTNKFYPNKGQGRFYQPSEETQVVFHANYPGSDVETRTQKILKQSVNSAGERMHKNLFNRPNSTFLGWGNSPTATTNSYEDSDVKLIKTNETLHLYARWTNPVSYHLFAQKDWVGSTGAEYINTLSTLSIGKKVRIQYLIKGGVWLDNAFSNIFGCEEGYMTNNTFHPGTGFFNPFEDGSGAINGDYVWFILRSRKAQSPNTAIEINLQYRYKGAVGGISSTKIGVSVDQVNIYEAGFTTNGDIFYNSYGPDGLLKQSDTRALSVAFPPLKNVYGFYLFADNLYGGEARYCVGKIYSYQLINLSTDREEANFVPCVLSTDLTSDVDIVDAAHARTGETVKGNTKTSNGKNYHKGDCGFWDLVSDRFFGDEKQGSGLYVDEERYLVRYDGNGGLGTVADQEITSSTSYVRLRENRYSYAGKEFIGWNSMPDGTGDWYSDERVLHKGEYKNMTLFAQWRETPENPPYVQIEYIQNNGTGTTGLAYINTKVKAANNFRYYLKFVRLGASSCNIIGGYYPGHVHLNGSIYLAGVDYATIGSGTLYEVDGGRYNNLVDARYTANGGSWTAAATGAVNNNSMNATVLGSTWSLFARYPNISDGNGCKIYGFKLWNENEELIRDMIPVMLTEDIPASSGWDGAAHKNGELGLWDKCEGKFYSNANSSGYFSNADLQIVQYNANGGSGTMPNQAFFLTSEKVALNETAFTNGKKRFIGWNTAQDGSGVWYGDAYESADWEGGLLVLYAQWTDTGDTGSILTQYFEPVNYIRSVSFATIDTKIQAKNVDMAYSYRVKFSAFSCFVCGVAVDTASVDDVYFQNATTARIDYKKKQSSKTLSPALTTTKIHAISQSGRTLTIDGKSYTGDTASYSYPTDAPNVVLFNKFTGNSNYQFSGCLYGAEVSNGTEKVKLIPCVLKKKISAYEAATLSADGSIHSEGEVGMWDLINNKFYGNANSSGVFTCEKN